MKQQKNPAAVALGRKGGMVKTAKKSAAGKKNAAKARAAITPEKMRENVAKATAARLEKLRLKREGLTQEPEK